MKCEDVTSELIAYAGGRVISARSRELERHAASCADCRALVEQFSALSSVLDELPTIEPSFGFDARVRQQVGAEPARGWLGGLIPQPRLALSGAMLVLLAVWVVKMQPLRQGPPVPVAQASTQQEDFNAIQDLRVLENYDVVTKMDALSELVPATAQPEKPSLIPTESND